jgi:rare lipoprotein A
MRTILLAILLFPMGSITGWAELTRANAQPVRRASETRVRTMTAIAYPPHMFGRKTASGESYDPSGLTVAHRTLPFGARLEVFSPGTGRSVMVTVNDRGSVPGSADLITSEAAMHRLGLPADRPAAVTVRLWPSGSSPLSGQDANPSPPAGRASPAIIGPRKRPASTRPERTPEPASTRVEQAPEPASAGLPRFSIQLGAYSDVSAARAVAATMQEAWIQTAAVKGQSVHRVFYGRYAEREDADAWQARLAGLGVSGYVRTLRP